MSTDRRTPGRRLTGIPPRPSWTGPTGASSSSAAAALTDSPTAVRGSDWASSPARGANYGSFVDGPTMSTAADQDQQDGPAHGRTGGGAPVAAAQDGVGPPPSSAGGPALSTRSTPIRLSRRWTPSQEQLIFSTASTNRRRPRRGSSSGPLREQGSRATSLLTLFNDAVGPTSPPHYDADLPPIDLSSDEDDFAAYEESSRALLPTTEAERHRDHSFTSPVDVASAVVMEDDDDVPDGFGTHSHERQTTNESEDPTASLLSRPDHPTSGRYRSRSRSGMAEVEQDERLPEKQYGVLKAEITSRRLRAKQTGWGLWVVYIGIYLLSVTLSVETNALPVVEPFFLSLFGAHGLLSSVVIVTNIAYAVGKPPMAKIMDVFGRAEGVVLAAIFYFLGAMLTTSANNVVQYAIARTLGALGTQGLLLSQQIIVADTSTLASRALLTSTISSPWLITTWIGPWIGEAFKNGGETGYRAIYAVFGIVVPIFALGLAGILWWEWRIIIGRRKSLVALEHQPNRPTSPSRTRARATSSASQREQARGRHSHHHSSGARKSSPSPSEAADDRRNKRFDEGSHLHSIRNFNPRTVVSLGKEAWTQMDVLGIALLTVGCSTLLLPLTLASRRPQSWADPKLYVLLVCAVIILVLFGLYETRKSKCPIMPPRLLKEKTIVAGSLLCFFHFLCQFIYESYFTSFLQVARYNTARDASYISESYIFTACISALICGVLVKWSCRYKIWVIVGIAMHAIGAILMVRFRRLENPTWELVLSQVIAGAGGGFTTLGTQLGVQSVVSHQDVGIATAVFLTITQVGGAVGASIAGAVWTTLLPKRLKDHLPPGADDRIDEIVSNLNAALSFARGSAERDAINNAYIDVQKILNFLSLAALVPCLVCAFQMKNVDLSNPERVDGEVAVALDRASSPPGAGDTERCSLLEEEEER